MTPGLKEPPPATLHVGRITRAQGLKGQVRLSTFDHEAPSLRPGVCLWLRGADGTDRGCRVAQAVRRDPDAIVVTLEGVTDRTGAEALVGVEVHVDEADLPPLEDGEFWAYRLVGLAVTDEAGTALGTVEAVEPGAAHDLVSVRTPGGVTREVPLVDALVARVDMDARVVVIRPIPGLLDDGDDEPAG